VVLPEEVSRNSVKPGDPAVITVSPKTLHAPKDLGERLRGEVARRLGLVDPAAKEVIDALGVAAVEDAERIGIAPTGLQ